MAKLFQFCLIVIVCVGIGELGSIEIVVLQKQY